MGYKWRWRYEIQLRRSTRRYIRALERHNRSQGKVIDSDRTVIDHYQRWNAYLQSINDITISALLDLHRVITQNDDAAPPYPWLYAEVRGAVLEVMEKMTELMMGASGHVQETAAR